MLIKITLAVVLAGEEVGPETWKNLPQTTSILPKKISMNECDLREVWQLRRCLLGRFSGHFPVSIDEDDFIKTELLQPR